MNKIHPTVKALASHARAHARAHTHTHTYTYIHAYMQIKRETNDILKATSSYACVLKTCKSAQIHEINISEHHCTLPYTVQMYEGIA
jgi:hypothetical protein